MGTEGRAGSQSLRPLTKIERDRFMQRVAEELGFKLVGHKLELYGVPVKRPRRV